jgi:hypothetical protein
MSDQDPGFAAFNRTYRPWGQVRRKNLISRILYGMVMTVIGLAVLAGIALLVVFAGMVVVGGVVAFAVMALLAALTRRPSKVFVRTQPRPDGVLGARKKGSTWTVY